MLKLKDYIVMRDINCIPGSANCADPRARVTERLATFSRDGIAAHDLVSLQVKYPDALFTRREELLIADVYFLDSWQFPLVAIGSFLIQDLDALIVFVCNVEKATVRC